MTKKIYHYLCCALIALSQEACTDAVDKTNLGAISDDVVWQDPKLIVSYFDNIMRNCTPGAERDLASNSDESVYYNGLLYDNYTANTSDRLDQWHYRSIRKINRFLDHFGYDGFNSNQPATPTMEENLRQDMLGQILVMRSYLYFDMVRRYGGVPLLLHEQIPSGMDFEALQTPRAKTSECINQIVKDLDAAIAIQDNYFPMKKSDGHVSKAVAYALKAKVLLYYASPQFVNKPGLTSSPAGTKSVEERRQEAYAACKEAYEKLSEAGFGLYAPEGGDRQTIIDNYYKMLVTDEMNKEMVWVRRYEPLIFSNGTDRDIRPSSSWGGAWAYPTLEMVNAFANADGTPFTGMKIDRSHDASSTTGDIIQGAEVASKDIAAAPNGDPINKEAFWLNREPRFYAFVNYNGAEFPIIRQNQEAFPFDMKDGKLQHGWIVCWGNSTQCLPFDGGWSATNDRGAGFSLRKFVSDDRNYGVSGTNPLKECGTDWPLIRFAEVMLNYAEAAAMVNKPSEAYNMLDQIRKRAGILPDNAYGLGRKVGDALILDILNERRIELCCEGHRVFDMRRWRLFSGGLPGFKLNGTRRHTIQSWVLGEDGRADNLMATHVDEMAPRIKAILDAGGLDTEAGVKEYFKVFFHSVMLYDSQDIQYNPDRQDFLRIPYNEHIQKNPLIEQTQGWTDDRGSGTFDPYL